MKNVFVRGLIETEICNMLYYPLQIHIANAGITELATRFKVNLFIYTQFIGWRKSGGM
jgi:hypothetical protein